MIHSIIRIAFILMFLFSTLSGTVQADDSGKLATKEFGIDGWVSEDFGDRDFASAVAIQVDGKLVVVGQAAAQDFGVLRFTRTGVLDDTFGINGEVITDFGGIDSAKAVAIQSDGKIVVAGFGAGAQTAVARYETDGSLDTSFGFGGVLIGDSVRATGVAIQGDGKIVTIGGGGLSNSWRLTRILPNGTLDSTFGFEGLVINRPSDFGGSFPSGIDVAIRPDGKIVAAGRISRPPAEPDAPFGIGLARYHSDGALDTSFGNDGTVITPVTTSRDIKVLLQEDGKVVVGGTWVNHFLIARYLSNGMLDTSFVGTGEIKDLAVGADGGLTSVRLSSIGDRSFLTDIALDNGRITGVGWADQGSSSDFVLARFKSDGTRDNSFDSDGKVRTDFGVESFANGVAARFDRFFVTGVIDEDFGLAKYVASGIDGIGRIRQYITTVDCPDDVLTDTASEQCGAHVSYPPPIPGDPGTVTCTPASESFFSVDTTQVLCKTVAGDGVQNQQREATCGFEVAVVDTQAPRLSCPDVTVPTEPGQCSAVVSLGVSTADNCPGSPPPVISPSDGSRFILGETDYEVMATDAAGNNAGCSSTVAVVDEEVPEVIAGTELTSLWPPNHKFVDVGLSVIASDNCGITGEPAVTVFSNEPGASGAVEFAGATLKLRSERNRGRVYLITAEIRDDSGNIASAAATVVVPKSRSNKHVMAVNDLAASAKDFFLVDGAKPPGFVVVGSN